MGKFANLIVGIFLIVVSYLVNEVYNTILSEFGEPSEFLPFNLETIVTYFHYGLLGFGILLISVALIRFGIAAFRKYKEYKGADLEIPDEDDFDDEIQEEEFEMDDTDPRANAEKDFEQENSISRSEHRERRKKRRELRRNNS